MTNLAEISKDEAREIGATIFSAQDRQNFVAAVGGKVNGREARNARAKWALSAQADAMVVTDGMTAGNVAEACGMAGGTFSKVRTIGRAAQYNTTGVTEENAYDEKVETFVKNLETFWNFETAGSDLGSLALALAELTSDEGEVRVNGVRKLYGVFGATENAYHVGKGNKFHDQDPRANDDDDDQYDDDQDPSKSWQEIVTEGARRAAESGATMTEVIALVRSVMGE